MDKVERKLEVIRYTIGEYRYPGNIQGDWASTRGNGFQMGGLSDSWSQSGGLFYPINSRKRSTLNRIKKFNAS